MELLEFNLNMTGNLSRFEQVQYVATQPYFLTGFLATIAFMILLFLIIGFTHVTGKSRKVCFQSSVYWRGFLIIFLGMLLFFFLFIVPVPFNIFGG